MEALEEAGVTGIISSRPVGAFRYDKLLDEKQRIVPCEVVVFALRVQGEALTWREMNERETRWLTREQAAALAADSGLREIIAAFRATGRECGP